MKAVLAAIDLSPVSERVVFEAAALARAIGARVVLISVLVEPVFLAAYAPPPASLARIAVGQERAVRRRLQRLCRQLAAQDVAAGFVVRRGHAANEILAEAERRRAAVIVVGSHGHSAFYNLVLGSPTQALLRRTRRPVVVIPRQVRRLARRRRPARIGARSAAVERATDSLQNSRP